MNRPSVNQARKLVPYYDTLAGRKGFFSGRDQDGLLERNSSWQFHYGFSYVPMARLESFEQAINSMRFKRPVAGLF